jgi:DNA (cytosine-5)-methyltransferase 1
MKNSYITATDQFCGAGGSSIGATAAGVEVRLAMNHWKLAIETHNTNFPNVDHVCTDISATDPRRYPSTNILITSPECTNHSLAKGRARRYYERDLFGNILIDPSEERSRATMWDVPRFAEYHEYEIITVENVVDAGKWRMFDAWLSAMHALGYEHEIVYFNSMFSWPTPQSRDRMYTVFWKRGNKKPDLEFRPQAWCQHCASNVESIQTWKKGKWGRYRAQYFYRCPHCHKQVEPYYYAAFNAIDFSIPAERIGDRQKPLKPKTLARIQYGLDTYGRKPMIVTGRYTTGVGSRVRDAEQDVIPTQPGDSSHAVVMPWLVDTNHSQANGKYVNNGTGPLATQTTQQSQGVVLPYMVKTIRPDNEYSFALGGEAPMWAQTTCQDVGVVGFLCKQYGGQADPKYMSAPLDAPTGTITTWDHHAFVQLPAGFIAEMHGNSNAGGLHEPLMCVTTSGSHHALVSADAFLTYYNGAGARPTGMNDPVGTITGSDRVGISTGALEALEKMTVDDLTFRMLQPPEIGKAMAFPSSYVVKGNGREQVKQYGNAVTPPVMDMLMERCMATFA